MGMYSTYISLCADFILFQLVLHPHHKLAYFRSQNQEVQWIELAEGLVRNEYDHHYQAEVEVIEALGPSTKDVICHVSLYFIQSLYANYPQDDSQNIYDNLPALAPPLQTVDGDEVTTYLNRGPKDVGDAIKWWYLHKTIYPNLYHIALNYLTIPGLFFFFNCFA